MLVNNNLASYKSVVIVTSYGSLICQSGHGERERFITVGKSKFLSILLIDFKLRLYYNDFI